MKKIFFNKILYIFFTIFYHFFIGLLLKIIAAYFYEKDFLTIFVRYNYIISSSSEVSKSSDYISKKSIISLKPKMAIFSRFLSGSDDFLTMASFGEVGKVFGYSNYLNFIFVLIYSGFYGSYSIFSVFVSIYGVFGSILHKS